MHGIFCEIQKGPIKAYKYYEQAYDQIKTSLANSVVRQSFEERRDNADLILVKLLLVHLKQNNHQQFKDLFNSHFQTYQQKMSHLSANLQFEEFKWRANLYRIGAEMLEQALGQRQITLADVQLFPGYYFMNSMLQLKARLQSF